MNRPPPNFRPYGGGGGGAGGRGFPQHVPLFPQNPFFLQPNAFPNFQTRPLSFPTSQYPNPMNFPPYHATAVAAPPRPQANPAEVLAKVEETHPLSFPTSQYPNPMNFPPYHATAVAAPPRPQANPVLARVEETRPLSFPTSQYPNPMNFPPYYATATAAPPRPQANPAEVLARVDETRPLSFPTSQYPNPMNFPPYQATTVAAPPRPQANPPEVLARVEETRPLSFPTSQYPNPMNFPPYHATTISDPPRPQANPAEVLARVEAAVEKARQELLAAGKNVSSWKVSQSALLSLKVDSWTSLGIQMQDVPSLHDLIVTEGEVEAFIHCFVAVRRITTIHELDVAICNSEGIDQFEVLGLGPLLRHPLVVHYFSVPPDMTEVFNITTDDILSCLSTYIDKCKKAVKIEAFLDYLLNKHDVAIKEKLGVRIQSLWLYITHIKEAKKAENATLNRSSQLLCQNSDKKTREEIKVQPLSMAPDKAVLDERFNSICNRVKSFSETCKDFGNTHIRFDSSDCDDGDDSDSSGDDECDNVTNKQSKAAPVGKDGARRVSSCPYPSTSEEMARLGQKTDTTRKRSQFSNKKGQMEYKTSSGKKRKSETQNIPTSDVLHQSILNEKEKENDLTLISYLTKAFSPSNTASSDSERKNVKEQKSDLELASYLSKSFTLSSAALGDFASTWKEACQQFSAIEVLSMMLSFYGETMEKKKKAKTLRSMIQIFSSYPGIGLLNIAVASMKMGVLNSIYDTFESFQKGNFLNATSAAATETIDIGLSLKELKGLREDVQVVDIIEKMSNYFADECFLLNDKEEALDKNFSVLKRLRDCETWVTTQFIVKEFRSLGYGDFFEFIQKNTSSLPCELYNYLMGDPAKKSSSLITMTQSQLEVFLSQAANSLSENDNISIHNVSMLFHRQFPTFCLHILGKEPEKSFADILRRQRDTDVSRLVYFSSALLGKLFSKSSACEEKKQYPLDVGMKAEVTILTSFSQYSLEDAVKCLTNAPMLSDLISWSHWDILYAPSMGPLIEWLLSGIHCNELKCIATRDGRLIRIEQSATADDFFEAAIQGSAFKAAVKLLSLVPLYGGAHNVPMSLLKHFAQRAIEVIIKNSEDSVEPDISPTSFKHRKTLVKDTNGMHTFINHGDTMQEKRAKGFSSASTFIFNCLGHLPPEFHSFAADIFVSALQYYTKDAYLFVLHECKTSDQRCMLHSIGLSLGIQEWIEDYNVFTETASDLMSFKDISETLGFPEANTALKQSGNTLNTNYCSNNNKIVKSGIGECLLDNHQKDSDESHEMHVITEKPKKKAAYDHAPAPCKEENFQDAASLIESIRREEFGLDSNLEHNEASILKKQHARLGRALHCLSQELYSQDSHLLLELIQNADDNFYPGNVDPTLVFILQANGIVVLNNERGFYPENIRALCDIGNSTKKVSSAGYIGNKGIGFKSVFRITDAPEIHSNGFHLKFDLSEGQIGFVLPTLIAPCDMNIYTRQLSYEGQDDASSWKTCIVLPFQAKLKEEAGLNSILSLFSDLHPSLLLFLHKLRCIQFNNVLNNTHFVMRRESLNDGIVRVSCGNEKMSWLIVSQKLQSSLFRHDVESTEISLAFTLQESENGVYKPYLTQQPVFAFLPLRQYGLKFILQGDFVLPSSREEVDGNSAWNQWLLSEIPALFVGSEKSFCDLPCFVDNPEKAVSAFMSFIPLSGEVHGFFSHLPNMILSKLRVSNCLLLEDHRKHWVPPCKVLRGWDEQARLLLSDNLLEKHLGLGFLRKDIILSDPLANALGIKNYGSKVLADVISSNCHSNGDIKFLGFEWLASWFVVLDATLSMYSATYRCNMGIESDLLSDLKNIAFIPLSDGSYGSVSEGPIWLSCDHASVGCEGKHGPEDFPHLYSNLRIVNPLLLSAEMSFVYNMEDRRTDNLTRMLRKVGVQQLSAHDIIKTHVLPALNDDRRVNVDTDLMTEYLSFVMLHFQYDCPSCSHEKEGFVSHLQKNCIILTNHGYKCPAKEPIHFSKEFSNPINTAIFFDNGNSEWHEVDAQYLSHPVTQSLKSGVAEWREFFLALGVTDFVRVIHAEKNASDFLTNFTANTTFDDDFKPSELRISDWESPELVHLLSTISAEKYFDKCKYLLEVFDRMWDEYYSAKVTGSIFSNSSDDRRPILSSFMKTIHNIKWIASSTDEKLHLPKDVYHDCEIVRSILGTFAPYSLPKVSSKKLLEDIGFKTQVTFDDALTVIRSGRMADPPFKASTSQMMNFYNFIWDGFLSLGGKISDDLKSLKWIFVPFIGEMRCKDVVSGLFLPLDEVFWHDPTGCVDYINEITLQNALINDSPGIPCNVTTFQNALIKDSPQILCKMLANVYPSLHDFFVSMCGVQEMPPFCKYVEILLQLARIALPSQASLAVFRVFLKWADDFEDRVTRPEEVIKLKDSLSKLENKVFPTIQDRWVSLHPSFGLICWSDDVRLRDQFKHCDNIHFLQFGELERNEKRMLSGKLISLLQKVGICALSEVISREAIFYGAKDNHEKSLLVNWVLPFAQRYIYKLHPSTYRHVKQFLLEKMNQFQVCVVVKLFYKQTLKGKDSASKERFECKCLLQGNILYVTQAADPHSIFLELSRFLFNGSANLHLANFLQMITTMAESGSTEEQLEYFIANSQEMPKLPVEELSWSLSLLSSTDENKTDRNTSPQQDFSTPVLTEQSSLKRLRKPAVHSNWPPTNWKNAPGFGSSLTYKLRIQSGVASNGCPLGETQSAPNPFPSAEDIPINIDSVDDWTLEGNSEGMGVLEVDQKGQTILEDSCDFISQSGNDLESIVDSENSMSLACPRTTLNAAPRTMKISFNASNAESYRTGRLGEAAAYRYFSEKLSFASVKWVNREAETGLPYDLLIGDNDEKREYVEVKTTRSKSKNWFSITTREWLFAVEKGDAFSIAHVVLVGPKAAQISLFKNPFKLCLKNMLQLVISVPYNKNDQVLPTFV